MMGFKICKYPHCRKYFPNTKRGLICTDCQNDDRKLKRRDDKVTGRVPSDKLGRPKKLVKDDGTTECTNCHNWFTLDLMHNSWCKKCEAENTSRYRKENPDKVRETNRAYTARNIERVREWNIINKRIYNEKYPKVSNLKHFTNDLIRDIRDGNDINENDSKYSKLGCSIEQFCQWIEFQFTEEMDWDTYPQNWEIDHVLPYSYFDLENDDEYLQCTNWKNLRPLNPTENNSKKNKIDEEVINSHQKLVESFLSQFQKEEKEENEEEFNENEEEKKQN